MSFDRPARHNLLSRFLALTLCFCPFHILVTPLQAIDSWPGGETSRIDITQSGMASNLSGAVWNSETKKLWVVSNAGYVWRLSCASSCLEASNWAVDDNGAAYWNIGGDSEAITQADFSQTNTVFIGIEQANSTNHRLIREYTLSPGQAAGSATNEWNLVEMRIGDNNQGLEALSFVPDEWLTSAGFVDQNNQLYTGSQFGTGGLFFAGLQGSGADIFVFDLNRNVQGEYTFIGQYDVGQTEMASMEFDRSDGILYTWHNYGDSGGNGSQDILQAVGLTPSGSGSVKTLPVLDSWYGPRIHNNEGIAVVPNGQCNNGTTRNFFLTTDDGGIANSLGIYPNFPTTYFPDEDGDGVADCEDFCPGTPSGTPVNQQGCELTPTPTATITITATATPTPTLTPTASPTPTLTPTLHRTSPPLAATASPAPKPLSITKLAFLNQGTFALRLTNPNEAAAHVKLALVKTAGVPRRYQREIASHASWRKTLRTGGQTLTLLTATSESGDLGLAIRPSAHILRARQDCTVASKISTLQSSRSLSTPERNFPIEELYLYVENENPSRLLNVSLDFFTKRGKQVRSSVITLQSERLKRVPMASQNVAKVIASTVDGQAARMAAISARTSATLIPGPRCMTGAWLVPSD